MKRVFLLQCNYDVNQINSSSTFYQDISASWSNIREISCEGKLINMTLVSFGLFNEFESWRFGLSLVMAFV